jgi:hypothetical protein
MKEACAVEVQTDAIRGSYDQLLDAAEDIGAILGAAAANQLDLTPVMQVWLVQLLERVDETLAPRSVA